MAKHQALIEHLSEFATEGRLDLFKEKIQWRTKHLCLVLEDIYQSQNASAVLRSADCFGIQDVHVVENSNEYDVNPDVALGSSNWVSLHRYNSRANNTGACLSELKAKGFHLVATSPLQNAKPISELSLEKPIALLFGTEMRGLTDEAFEMADESVYIPMFGFTESFNISVSAALCMYDLSTRLRVPEVPWKLTKEQEEEVMLHWLRNSIGSSESLEKRFLSEAMNKNL